MANGVLCNDEFARQSDERVDSRGIDAQRLRAWLVAARGARGRRRRWSCYRGGFAKGSRYRVSQRGWGVGRCGMGGRDSHAVGVRSLADVAQYVRGHCARGCDHAGRLLLADGSQQAHLSLEHLARLFR